MDPLTLAEQLSHALHDTEPDPERRTIALARCLRVLSTSVYITDAFEPVESLADDIEAQARKNIERARADEAEHEHYMRTSSRYRRAEMEGSL